MTRYNLPEPIRENCNALPTALYRWYAEQPVCDRCVTPIVADDPARCTACPWCGQPPVTREDGSSLWARPGDWCVNGAHRLGSHAHSEQCVPLEHRPRRTHDPAPVPLYVAMGEPEPVTYRIECPRCGTQVSARAKTDKVALHGPGRSCGGFILQPEDFRPALTREAS